MDDFISILPLVNGFIALAIVIVFYVIIWYYCHLSIKKLETYNEQWEDLSPATLAKELTKEATREEKKRIIESFFARVVTIREENRRYIHIRLRCKRFFAKYKEIRHSFSLDSPAPSSQQTLMYVPIAVNQNMNATQQIEIKQDQNVEVVIPEEERSKDAQSSQAVICLALSKAKEFGEYDLSINTANAQELARRFGGECASWLKHLGKATLSRYEKNESMRNKAIRFLKGLSEQDTSLDFTKTIQKLEEIKG